MSTDGALTLELNSGLTIEVQPHPAHEAWQLSFAGHMIVAMPGGELAIWDEASSKR
jgi:hypothetical protein